MYNQMFVTTSNIFCNAAQQQATLWRSKTVRGGPAMKIKIVGTFAALILAAGTAWAADPPQTPPKTTIPGTGGYGWGSGPPQTPPNTPPASGGSVGVQYPPDRGPTTTTCRRNGVVVPC